MQLILGPILRFRGAEPATGAWRVSVLVVLTGEGDPYLSFQIAGSAPTSVLGVEMARPRRSTWRPPPASPTPTGSTTSRSSSSISGPSAAPRT